MSYFVYDDIPQRKKLFSQRKHEEAAIFSGDGVTTVFRFPHKKKVLSDRREDKPYIKIRPGTTDTEDHRYHIKTDSTNIIVTFDQAPPPGVNNLSFYYSVH